MHRTQEGNEDMKKMKLFGLGLGLLAVVAIAQPANAACGAPFLISTTDAGTGEYSYVINPGVTDNGFNGSTITDQLTGFFWGVGIGNPALGVGADNGSFAALDWFYIYPGFPAGILTTWAASAGIDTCIDVQGALGSRCQATFLQDVDPSTGQGVFALISTADDPASGDFYLNLEGGAAINLAPAAQMPILNSTRNGDQGVTVQLGGPTAEALAAGAYLDAALACQGAGGGGTDPLNGLVDGYSIRYQVLPRGSQPPSDFGADGWNDGGTGVLPLGMPGQVAVDCGGQDADVYLTYQLHLDSGFAAPLVSASSTRIECGPNVADPQQRIRIAPDQPETRQKPTTRQRTR